MLNTNYWIDEDGVFSEFVPNCYPWTTMDIPPPNSPSYPSDLEDLDPTPFHNLIPTKQEQCALKDSPDEDHNRNQKRHRSNEYKVFRATITFPPEVFGEEMTNPEKEEWMKRMKSWTDANCDKAIVSSERGEENDRYHWEAVLTWKGFTTSANVKKYLMRVFGLYNHQNPDIRKHAIKVRAATYEPGAYNYTCKQNRGDIINFGIEPTWLSDQIEKGQLNKKIRAAEDKVYVTDITFDKIVASYIFDNDLQNDDIVDIMYHMMRNGFSFKKVKAKRQTVAEWRAQNKDDKQSWLDAFARDWEPRYGVHE